MSITVRFFASLREKLKLDELQIEVHGIKTVSDVWRVTTNNLKLPENVLFAVNLEYVKFDSLVNDNDEVAFFPPVTGG